MVKLNKNTQVCISISSNPSNTGTFLHNACYDAQGLDFIYKAFKVTDLEATIRGVRALNIRGCSVSMPFKQTIIKYLDEISPLVKQVKCVNTVLNDNGRLIGHNTDLMGVLKIIGNADIDANDSVLILGAGGMARALIVAFQKLGINKISISSRDPNRYLCLAKEFNISSLDWETARKSKADILVNATPIGMPGYPDDPIFNDDVIRDSHTLIDVVISDISTPFNEKAIQQGKTFISGLVLAKAQMIYQYEIYTGIKPPNNIIENFYLGI